MEPSNDAHQNGLHQLRKQLAAQRASRKQAQRTLKARAAESLACTPTYGTCIESTDLNRPTPAPPTAEPNEEPVMDSGIGQLPTAERLDARREQLKAARKARKNGLAKLKRTTCDAVRVVGETTLLELGELKKRLSDSSEDHRPALGT